MIGTLHCGFTSYRSPGQVTDSLVRRDGRPEIRLLFAEIVTVTKEQLATKPSTCRSEAPSPFRPRGSSAAGGGARIYVLAWRGMAADVVKSCTCHMLH